MDPVFKDLLADGLPRYAYEVLEVHPLDLKKVLNHYGLKGWELVSMNISPRPYSWDPSIPDTYNVVLKRPWSWPIQLEEFWDQKNAPI